MGLSRGELTRAMQAVVAAVERAVIRLGGVLRLAPVGWAVWPTCAAGLALRLWVAFHSVGSDDAVTWEGFARSVRFNGLAATYRLDSQFNHPPLMGEMAAAAQHIAQRYGLAFAFVFKIPAILASTVLTFLLMRRVKLSWPWLVVLLLNPLDVMVSAYHGNTDVVCALFAVAATMAVAAERPLIAGLLLGAAINVKLIPVLLIAPLLICLPSYRTRFWMLFGLGFGVIPFVPILLTAREAFVHNAVDYGSVGHPWGLCLFAYGFEPAFPKFAAKMWKFLAAHGKHGLLAVGFLFSLLSRWTRTLDTYRVAAFVFTVFLVLAPGFGVQYLIYTAPFLVMAFPRRGLVYLVLASAYAFSLYHWYWTKTFPPQSHFFGWPDLNSILLGFVVWLALAGYFATDLKELGTAIWKNLRRGAST